MFANHLLEVLDFLEADVILPFAKIYERTRVSAMLGNHHLDRAIRIDLRNRGVLTASDQCQAQSNQRNRRPKNCIDRHSISKVLCTATVVQQCTRTHLTMSF